MWVHFLQNNPDWIRVWFKLTGMDFEQDLLFVLDSSDVLVKDLGVSLASVCCMLGKAQRLWAWNRMCWYTTKNPQTKRTNENMAFCCSIICSSLRSWRASQSWEWSWSRRRGSQTETTDCVYHRLQGTSPTPHPSSLCRHLTVTCSIKDRYSASYSSSTVTHALWNVKRQTPF